MSDAVRYHVFLSHATPDKPAVKEIARRLKAEGIEPWLDEWNLIPGDAWQPAIEDALRQCATCAVFVGPGALGGWQNEEMRLVDQFEEVFTLCGVDSDRKSFFANLIYAAMIPGGRTVVVLTMRTDFYGKCGPYPALAAALSDHQCLVGPMTADELREAIERPARQAGGGFEAGLVEVLQSAIVDRPGHSPCSSLRLPSSGGVAMAGA
jgi:hypothetical protein